MQIYSKGPNLYWSSLEPGDGAGAWIVKTEPGDRESIVFRAPEFCPSYNHPLSPLLAFKILTKRFGSAGKQNF